MHPSDKRRYLTVLQGGIPDRVPIHDTIFNRRYIEYATGCRDYEATHDGMPPEILVPMAEKIAVDMVSVGYYWRPENFNTWEQVRELPFPSFAPFIDHVRRFAEYLKGRHTGLNVYVHGPLDSTYLSMGYQEFFLASIDDPDLVQAVMDRFNAHHLELIHALLDLPVDVFQIVDDVAMRNGLFIRPELMRKWWNPRMEALIEPIRARKRLMQFHSDGPVECFMNDIVDMGFAATNPIDPLCNDIREVKQRWGDRIALMGNMDLNILAQSTPEQVYEQMRAMLKDLMPGGRYIAMSGSSISDAVVPQNYDAMRAAVLEHGWY